MKVAIPLVTPCCNRKVTAAGSMLKRGLPGTYRICPKCRVYYAITLKHDPIPMSVIGPIQWEPLAQRPRHLAPIDPSRVRRRILQP